MNRIEELYEGFLYFHSFSHSNLSSSCGGKREDKGGSRLEEEESSEVEFSKEKSVLAVLYGMLVICYGRIGKALKSDKAKTVISMFTVGVIVLPILNPLGGRDERRYTFDDLPIEEEWDNEFNETVVIFIDDEGPMHGGPGIGNLVLMVTFNFTDGPYSTVLFVDGESFGFIEYRHTIFTIPVTGNVRLEFGAKEIKMRIEKLDYDGVVWNEYDDVVVKGKTYWEEYQRYWSGDYWGHRSIVSLPEPPDNFPPRHSVDVTSPDVVTLKHMAINEEGIYDYNEVLFGHRNITLRSDTTFFKVWTNDSNFYRLQFNWKAWQPPAAKAVLPDASLGGSGGTRGGEDDPITLSDDTPDEGDIVEIQVKVENSGDAGTGYFNVTTYVDRINGTTLIGNNVTSLGTGHSTTIYFNWDTTGTYGNHTIRAVLDVDNYVEEWNESNHASIEVFVNSTKLYQDSDGDTLPDAWEDDWGLNKSDASGINGTYGDPDQDGLHNLAEYQNNTLPMISDTDNDTLLDGDNNTLALLKLVLLEEKGPFDDHRFYLFVSRFETSEGEGIPYGGYRIPSEYNQYFNTSAGQPDENLSKSYIVKDMPIEVYNKGNSTPQGVFYITADKVNLSASSETPFDFENDNIRIRVNASLILNATSDPDPLVKDADWDGLEDAWEMVYLDTRGIDFRGMDSDGDGVEDILDVDSDNDHRTDGGDVRLFYFPTYEGEEYDYPLVQEGVRSHGESTGRFGNRYPEFGVNQSSPNMMEIGMTDPKDDDVDGDGLLDGVEQRIYGSDPLLSDTDGDGLEDAMEVQQWFTYDNVSIDKRFFDDNDLAPLNLSSYYEAHYKATIYADVRTNVDTEPDISDSIVIEIVETDEWQSRLTELEYTTFYDASGLDDDFTWIPVLFNFSFDTLVEDSPWIYISPNPEVFPPTLSDLEVHLKYAVVKILGSDVASGDTDGDGLSDYTEILMGTSISKPDTDSDRITDNAERVFWFGIIIPTYEQAVKLRTADVDDDGLLDGLEILYGTNPEEADEDNDGLLDFEEVLNYVTMWQYDLTETLVDLGTLSHVFAVSAKGDFLITLTINNTINRSVAYYDEDLLYEDDYMDEMNTWFMNNSSTVQYCHQTDPMAEFCEQARYDSDAIILNVTRFGNYVNTTELRKVYFFRNVTTMPIGAMGMDVHRIIYELNVVEPQALVVANFTEFFAGRRGVHPFNPDFDLDGVMDGLEVEVGANPFWLHSDLDWLNDFDEYYGTNGPRTNLTDEDTDGDGLWDGENIGGGGPTHQAPDHYGELTYGTNATIPDTDGDGLLDGFERGLGTDPTLWDTDGDSMADGWEYRYDLDPINQDGSYDYDSDGLNNSQEFVTDTDPKDEDVDDDLLEDGEEIYGVLFRTNVTDGALSIDNYESQQGYKWIFYNSTTHKKYQFNDQSAETWWVVSDDDASTQDNPRIYGDIIVWEDNQNGNWDIYYFSTANKTEVQVTDESADQRYPEIYGDIIVWQDMRNSEENWDIWAYNVTTGEETRVTDNESAQITPAIYGDLIVWVDYRNGTEDNWYQTEIYMYNLKNEFEARITNDSHNQTSPKVYENSIVWLDDTYSSWDVYIHQPSGSRYLVNDSHNQRNPQIYDNYVVWEDYRDGDWEIYLHDLKLASETRITNVQSEQKNVTVFGDKLLWTDYRDEDWEIYLYNITTKVKVKITDQSDAQTKPGLFEDRFVWVDERNGTKDVYLYSLTQFGNLRDGAPLFYNPVRKEIYVWEHNNSFYRFNETGSSEPCTITVPTIGYWNKELHEGPNIRHPDSDFDGLLDGRNSTVAKGSDLDIYYLSYELPFVDNGDNTVTFVGEKSVFTDPMRTDSDDDYLADAKEVFGYNISVKRKNGSIEKKFVTTHPSNDDCDNDELIDGRELSFQTDPNHPDADEDDLIDGYNVTTPTTSELFMYFTGLGIQYKNNGDGTATFVGELSMGSSPTNNESDGDGLPDGQEVFTNLTHPAFVDTENDGIPDGYESYYGLDFLSDDSEDDFDGDDFTNIKEYMYGTNPRHHDTDFDGLPDAWEFEFGISPLDNGTDLHRRDHDKLTNTWSYTELSGQGQSENGPSADIDEDGLSSIAEYSYMKPSDWDETDDGPWWGGLPPVDDDADDDTILDGSEVTERTYWWEAEDYTENDPIDDSSSGASGGYAAAATSENDEVFEIQWNLPSDDPDPHWKVMVKARKTGSSDGILKVYEGANLLGTLTVDETDYDWYSIAGLEFDKEGAVTVKGIDGEASENRPSIYVDKVLLLNVSYLYIDKICTNVDSQCSTTKLLDFPGGGGTKELYIRIPVAGGVPRYVIQAYISTEGDADPTLGPNLTVGDKAGAPGHQWHYFDPPSDWYYEPSDTNTTLDLSGEFNQFILNNTDADDGSQDQHISIPLIFESGNGGKLTIVSVYVRLWPFVSDPKDSDTDSDDLLDWEEIRSHNTSSLRLDSDNDYISDWSESNEDQRPLEDGDQFTDPVDSDTDDDELMDNDLEDKDPTTPDGDFDGLLDGEEFRLRTASDDPDTDDDGLLDGYNITTELDSDAYDLFIAESIYNVDIGGDEFIFLGEMSLGTKPTVADTDGDEQEDGEEWDDGTSYLNFDTDFDGLLDGADLTVQESDERYQLFVDRGIVFMDDKFKGEETAGSDPTKPDSDFDSLPDGWEVKFGLSPTDDGSTNEDYGPDGDPDEDELNNLDEFYVQTDPDDFDTDDDDLEDGWETAYGLDPLHDGSQKYILQKNYDYAQVSDTSSDDGAGGDPDKDGILNSAEQTGSTSPTHADTDGDGLLDGQGATVSTGSSKFMLWESQGILYKNINEWTVEFVGEALYSTDPLDQDSDDDNVVDGQEVLGYNVTIAWYEGEELKSENKTIFGHPMEAHMESDGVTPLDIDEDGITDIDEMDPVSSTTMSVEDFVEIYGDNQSMMDSQFNPFIRESLPPIVLNIAITKHERWGDCYFLGVRFDCLKRLWAEIEVEALDVSEFSVTVTISEDDDRSVTFVGKGHEWFMVALDLKLVEVLVRYKVSITMEDFAGNSLDPPFEKEMDGLFGGVLRMLEDLWDWLVDVATAIVDAVAKAVSFIFDMIVNLVSSLMNAIIDPVVRAIGGWIEGLISLANSVSEGVNETGDMSSYSYGDFVKHLTGDMMIVLMALSSTIMGIFLLTSPYTILFSFITSWLIGMIVPFVLSTIAGAVPTLKELLDPIVRLMSGDPTPIIDFIENYLLANVHSSEWETDWVVNWFGFGLAIASGVASGGGAVYKKMTPIKGELMTGDIKALFICGLGLALTTVGMFYSNDSPAAVILSLIGTAFTVYSVIKAKFSESESKFDQLADGFTIGGVVWAAFSTGYNIFRFTTSR